MHELRPIPRRENTAKTFDDDLIAQTLSNAADIRRTLRSNRGDLFLDAEGRRSNPEKAAQASTDECIRLAAMALYPDDSLDARDLRWHAATRFQRHIGYGIETYDNNNTTAETVAADLDKTAAEVRNPAARYTARRWKRLAILRPQNGSTTSSRNSPTTGMKYRYHRSPWPTWPVSSPPQHCPAERSFP